MIPLIRERGLITYLKIIGQDFGFRFVPTRYTAEKSGHRANSKVLVKCINNQVQLFTTHPQLLESIATVY